MSKGNKPATGVAGTSEGRRRELIEGPAVCGVPMVELAEARDVTVEVARCMVMSKQG